jgi:hypothetical protein
MNNPVYVRQMQIRTPRNVFNLAYIPGMYKNWDMTRLSKWNEQDWVRSNITRWRICENILTAF